MKKVFLICVCLLSVSALAWESFMDKCIQSWVGYPLESVIEKWGYPNRKKEMADKKVLVWEKFDNNYEENMNNFYVDKMWNENAFPSANVLKIDYCRKILEVNTENIVINGRWEGNDCPKFYKFGKEYVNPKNDKWAK